MQLSRTLRAVLAALLLVPVLALAGATSAGAQTTGDVRVIHGIPDVLVDVYVNDGLFLEDFAFGQKADAALEQGDYDVDVYLADADPLTDDPVISDTVAVTGGTAASVIASFDADGAPQLAVFGDDRSPTPATEGRVTVRHTAEAPAVNILVDGGAAASGVVNGQELVAELPVAVYDFGVQVAPDGPVVLTLDEVLIEPAVALTVYAVGSAVADPATLTTLVFIDDVNFDGSAVTVQHGIPGAIVDVYVDGGLVVGDFAPKNAAGPLFLDTGEYLVEIYGAGDDPLATDPIISEVVDVPTGGLDVTVIANLDDSGTPVLSVFVDDLSPVAAGTSRVVVRHTAQAPAVNVLVNGTSPFPALPYGEEIVAEIPAGTYELAVQVAPDGPVVLDLGAVPIPAGQSITVYAIGSASADPATLDYYVVGVEVFQNPFPDVPEGSQFFFEIGWMVSNGITNGYADGTFRPTAPVSRQATAAFLYRYAGFPNGLFPTCDEAPFSDVPADSPFCGEITWLVDMGIAEGFVDGTFRPTAPVSRQAAAAFLARYDGTPLAECSEAPFSDVPTSNPFCSAITWMVDAELTTGFEDGTFRPTIPVSRQAMSAFLYRYDQLEA